MATPTNVSYSYSGARLYAGKSRPTTPHNLAGAAGAQAAAAAALAVAKAMAGAAVAQGVVTASLTAGTINFAWDANPGGDAVTGYRLYWGSASGVYTSSVDVGNVTSYALTNPGVSRYYALTAINATGESAFSNELLR